MNVNVEVEVEMEVEVEIHRDSSLDEVVVSCNLYANK